MAYSQQWIGNKSLEVFQKEDTLWTWTVETFTEKDGIIHTVSDMPIKKFGTEEEAYNNAVAWLAN